MNRLNVFGYGLFPWYPRYWIKNIHQLVRNIGYAFQRATKGYCKYDLWDLDHFYTQIFINTLGDFTSDLHSAPDRFYDSEEDSPKKWIEYINEMRTHFYNSIEENQVKENDIKWNNGCYVDSAGFMQYSDTSEENEKARAAWYDKEVELATWREQELYRGLDMLKSVYQDLWD